MSLDLSRIRGLCFDIDGTLSDTDDRWVARLARGLAPFRPVLFGREPKAIARRVVMGIERPGNFLLGIPDSLGIDRPLADALRSMERVGLLRSPRRDGFWLVPQARETLAALAPHFPMAVVSARDEPDTQAFLEQFDLGSFFRCVCTAFTCEHTKPYPDPVRWASAQMGLSPDRVVMIGDTTIDIRAGRAAGAQTIGVLCGFGEEPELRRAGADLILPTTARLPDALLHESP
ncbi:MAG TPA: HAD family hydrolase [Anaerolineaceae bacterium]|nr:HAD family hydrolase [Anaerolineaceae bacterium]